MQEESRLTGSESVGGAAYKAMINQADWSVKWAGIREGPDKKKWRFQNETGSSDGDHDTFKS